MSHNAGIFQSLNGQRFDNDGARITVLRTFQRVQSDGRRATFCACICDCKTEFEALAKNIKSGTTRSCGCIRAEKNAERIKKYHARRKAA